MPELVGYSGCKLELIDKKVRKTAPPEGFGVKLSVELEKLQNIEQWSKGCGLNVTTPEIKAIGCDDDGCLSWYEMEYIEGELLTTQEEDRIRLVELMIAMSEMEWEVQRRDEHGFLVAKLKESLPFVVDGEYANYITWLSELELKGSINLGFCHGDFNPDNIIERGDEWVLIDPLKNLVDNVYWDVSKLMQGSWAQWKDIRNNTEPKEKPSKLVDLLLKLGDVQRTWIYTGVTLARNLKYVNEQQKIWLLGFIDRAFKNAGYVC